MPRSERRGNRRSLETLDAALHAYLAKRGDLCLAKNTWPIDLTQHEIDSGARNALQLPVLERLGLASWELHGSGANRQAVVTYTYRVDAASWTKDAEVQKVFPVVAGVIRGAGTAQLQETFAYRDAGWIAVDLQGT